MYRLCGENYQPSNNLSGHSYFLNIIRIPYYFQLSNVNFELTIVTWAIKCPSRWIQYCIRSLKQENFFCGEKKSFTDKKASYVYTSTNLMVLLRNYNVIYAYFFISLLLLFHFLLHTDNHQSFVVSKLFNDGNSSARKSKK